MRVYERTQKFFDDSLGGHVSCSLARAPSAVYTAAGVDPREPGFSSAGRMNGECWHRETATRDARTAGDGARAASDDAMCHNKHGSSARSGEDGSAVSASACDVSRSARMEKLTW